VPRLAGSGGLAGLRVALGPGPAYPVVGRRPLAELSFPSAKQVGIYRRQWRQTGTTTRVRASGCYSYQIDGTTFSRVVVFRAAP
jgi:hypothetical protein